jgi:DNA-binding GntR family transcriptional regulator
MLIFALTTGFIGCHVSREKTKNERKKTTVKANKNSDKLINGLMTAIPEGKFKPGERLVELRLCKLYNAKRSKIREILRKLEHEGFVKIIKNVGALVTEVNLRDVVEMHDILSVLDGLAMKIITPYITPKQIENLEKIIAKMESTDKPAELTVYNTEFLSTISSLSENKHLIKLADKCRIMINLFSFRNFSTPGQRAASISDHKKIVVAIKSGSVEEAESAMRKHVTDAKYRLVRWMDKTL